MNIIKANPTLLATAGFLGLGSAYACWRWYSSRIVFQPPEVWREVGALSDMMCFPIKSCGVIRMPSMECTEKGLKFNLLRDREFLVVDESGSFRTARLLPRMLLIALKLDGDDMVLNAPGMEEIRFSLAKLPQGKRTLISLWEKKFNSVDCGDDIAKWLSRFLLDADTGLRLVHYPMNQNCKNKSRLKVAIKDSESGAYPDYSSFNLMNESSVDDLNTRLPNDVRVDPQTFRPNFVVRGATAYEEDDWQWVRIGEVIFRVVKLCTRCMLTTVDHKTGVKNENQEPLATLRKYRMVGIKPYDKRSPVLGIHLVLHKAGWIRVGDRVFVA